MIWPTLVYGYFDETVLPGRIVSEQENLCFSTSASLIDPYCKGRSDVWSRRSADKKVSASIEQRLHADHGWMEVPTVRRAFRHNGLIVYDIMTAQKHKQVDDILAAKNNPDLVPFLF